MSFKSSNIKVCFLFAITDGAVEVKNLLNVFAHI